MPNSNPEQIDITTQDFKIIQSLLQKNVPQCTVWVFGSRVTKTAKKYSDLDIAILGDQKLPSLTISTLKEDFENSNLPFQVDIVDWHRINKNFQDIIEKNYCEIQKPATI